MTANPIMAVGLMLTLAGLVGSFFNVQLSQWLRDFSALEQKATLNQNAGTEDKRRVLVECKVEFAKLNRWQTYVTSIAALGFVVFVLGDGLAMASLAAADPLYCHVNVALWFFLLFFVVMSGWLLYSCHAAAKRVNALLNPPADGAEK